MSAHTPGPWLLDKTCVYALHYSDNGECNRFFVSVEGNPRGISTEELAANARLMAAAPDLLEALKEAVDYMPDATTFQRERIRIAHTAIAKAEGREP